MTSRFMWPIKDWIIHPSDIILWFHHSILWDFEMWVLQTIRVIYQEWLGHMICNMETWLNLSRVFFLKTFTSVRMGYCERASYLFIFVTLENEIFISLILNFFLWIREPCHRPPAGLWVQEYFQVKVLLRSSYSACQTSSISTVKKAV